jgi:mannose-6-phosphate isomerase-like protein (cupin superfamily)
MRNISFLVRVIAAKASIKGFVTDIEKDTVGNKNFRKVLYTGKNSQLVLMSLKPGENIGMETHSDVDQFFRVDSGSGKVVINGNETKIKDGFAVVVPQGAEHDVINTGKDDLKLYSIYSPPHHEDGTIHKSKEEAESSDEHFDGKTTE